MTDQPSNPSSDELVAQGIAAFQDRDITTARKLLTQAVKQDANNAQAWWYLSQVQTDDEKRLQCLRRVVKLDPQHTEATAALDALTQKLEVEMSREEKVLREEAKHAVPSSSVGGFSVPLPQGIDGAPMRLSLNDVVVFVKDKTAEALKLVRSPNSPVDLTSASWWQIVLIAVLVGLVTALVQLIGTALVSFRLLSVTSPIVVPLYAVLFALVGVGAAGFLSHWYITKLRGGKASLLAHSYPLTLIWAAASVINLVPTLIGALVGSGVLSLRQWLTFGLFGPLSSTTLVVSLLSLAVVVGAAYLMVKQLGKLYMGISNTQLWFTALIYVVVVGSVF